MGENETKKVFRISLECVECGRIMPAGETVYVKRSDREVGYIIYTCSSCWVLRQLRTLIVEVEDRRVAKRIAACLQDCADYFAGKE
jgi:hypothetical protein